MISDKLKKILMIIGFLAIVAVAGLLLWRMFASTNDPAEPSPTATSSTSYLPSSGPNSGTTIITPSDNDTLPNNTSTRVNTPSDTKAETPRDNKISSPNNFPILDAVLSTDGNSVQYYDPLEKKFYRLNENGEPVPLSDKVFHNVKNVSWSPDNNKAILEYPDGSKNIYNFNDNSQVSLPQHWEDFEFSPTGDQIAFKSIGLETDNRWLSIMNADGTQAVNIEKLGANADKAVVTWSPSRQIVATFQDGADYNNKEVFFIGLNHENFKSMVVQGRGLESQWSTTGNTLLYSVYSNFNGYRPSLWVTNANGDTIGENTTPLGVETWAHKCVFASDTLIYCAVPRSVRDGDGWLPSETISSPDDVYAIDIATSAKVLVSAEGDYNMSNLILTADQSTIYFTDNKTGGLYKLPIK